MAKEQQLVAVDFMGLGNSGDLKDKGGNKDNGISPNLYELGLNPLSGTTSSANNAVLFSSRTFTGVKHPIWSKAGAVQHVVPPGSVHGEKYVEQSAESTPEASYPHFTHPLQAWWQTESLAKGSPTAHASYGPKTQVMGSFAGLVPKNVTSLPPPNASTSLSETPLQMTAEVAEKRGTATLTIFYGGNVNVFEDITAEKAQAIMFLASNGNLQGMSPTDVLYGSEKKLEVTPESVPKTNAVNMTMASTKASTINVINFVNGVQLDQMNGYKVESCQTNNNQAGLSVQLDFVHASIPAATSNEEQPGVPSALPQARKASLARFLEKRRERVLSKSPYSLKQADSTLPEERTSSSNDIISCRRYGNNEKKISLPGWMEGFPGYPCDVVAKAE